MLAGKRAFEMPTVADTMSAVLNEDPTPISQMAASEKRQTRSDSSAD